MVSGQVAPGWYPDPGRQFETRYWDGARWTEHVASGGQQGTAPVVQAPPAAQTPSPFGTIYLDRMVSARIKGRHRLVLGDRALAWDAEVVPYPAVTAISHESLTVTTNVTATTTYQAKVWADPRMVHVIFMGGARDQDVRGVYELLVQVLADHIAPLLLVRLRDRVLAGEPVEIGAVTLDLQGVHRKSLGRRKDVTWGEVNAALAGGDGIGINIDRKAPNGLLLPALLRECAAAVP